jgi:hypothetical protein
VDRADDELTSRAGFARDSGLQAVGIARTARKIGEAPQFGGPDNRRKKVC